MLKVLVVDDSASERALIGGLVRKLGADAAVASSAKEALEFCQSEPRPEVVLTDLQMPEMSGLELVEELKRKHKRLPVVLMTAFGSEEIAARALRVGAANYVAKQTLQEDLPIVLESVRATLAEKHDLDHARDLIRSHRVEFELPPDSESMRAVVQFVQNDLAEAGLADKLVHISTALVEALTNAIEHGNLELDSELRSEDDESYHRLRAERKTMEPYASRRVRFVFERNTESIRFVIEDDGEGFDPTDLPDPTDPANLLRASGRGVVLMRTFMDEVTFSDRGNEVEMIKHLTAE